jgi:hypothetical protein
VVADPRVIEAEGRVLIREMGQQAALAHQSDGRPDVMASAVFRTEAIAGAPLTKQDPDGQ